MLGNKHLASFLTAFCLGLSVVQVKTLITDKGDFFSSWELQPEPGV